MPLNLSQLNGRYRPKMRFDRIYLRRSVNKDVEPEFVTLLGTQRLKNAYDFPSDHFGLYCLLNIKSPER